MPANEEISSVFLFVDDEIYEFTEGKLEQLAELPRPEKQKTPTKKETQVHETSGSVPIMFICHFCIRTI